MNRNFKTLIDALSRKLGVTLEAAADDRVLVDFDDLALLIEYLEAGEQILLAVPVGSPPKNNREAFYRKLLQGQYLFHKSGGATLALDTLAQFVSLQIVRDLRTLDEPGFLTLVEGFLDVANYWRKECEAAEATDGVDGVPQFGGELDATAMAAMLRV